MEYLLTIQTALQLSLSVVSIMLVIFQLSQSDLQLKPFLLLSFGHRLSPRVIITTAYAIGLECPFPRKSSDPFYLLYYEYHSCGSLVRLKQVSFQELSHVSLHLQIDFYDSLIVIVPLQFSFSPTIHASALRIVYNILLFYFNNSYS